MRASRAAVALSPTSSRVVLNGRRGHVPHFAAQDNRGPDRPSNSNGDCSWRSPVWLYRLFCLVGWWGPVGECLTREGGMCMLRMIHLYAVAALVMALSACSVEPPGGPARAGQGQEMQAEVHAVEFADPTDSEFVVSPSDDAIDVAANCSVVQFCNASGAEGTRCVQQGCSNQDAVRECQRETTTVCGSPVSPWIFVTTNGVHHGSTSSCILSGRCGGQAPSGCFCDSACTSLGDCCFDGPC